MDERLAALKKALEDYEGVPISFTVIRRYMIPLYQHLEELEDREED